jgi:hypothetical protein
MKKETLRAGERSAETPTDIPTAPTACGHTPGPWATHVDFDATGYPCYYIHGLSGDQKRDDDTLIANAALISAAPDLLAALKLVAEWQNGSPLVGGRGLPADIAAVVRVQIAKAEGTHE